MPNLPEGKVQVTFVVEDDVLQWLDEQAMLIDRSRSYVLRNAVDWYRLEQESLRYEVRTNE